MQALSEGVGLMPSQPRTWNSLPPPVATLCCLTVTVSLGAETTLLEGAVGQPVDLRAGL